MFKVRYGTQIAKHAGFQNGPIQEKMSSMANCVNCGVATAPGAKFCGGCGTPVGAGVAGGGHVSDTLDYTNQGDKLQNARGAPEKRAGSIRRSGEDGL